MSCSSACTGCVLDDVHEERIRQDEKWGEQNHPDGTGEIGSELIMISAQKICDAATKKGLLKWRHILAEEFFEAIAEADPDRLRAELVQVAAVAVAWCQAIDRRKQGENR